jgi:PUA domain protein
MYPDMYPRFTVDPGALKFVLKGANIMCPGLTNEFGSMEDV